MILTTVHDIHHLTGVCAVEAMADLNVLTVVTVHGVSVYCLSDVRMIQFIKEDSNA